MCSCEHASDVVADRQAGLVRTLANQVSDNTTGAGDDVVAVALGGATPMSSASHGPTQADDLFQEQCGTPIAEKFLKRLLGRRARHFSTAVAPNRWPSGGAGWLADQSQVSPEQPAAVGVGLGDRAGQPLLQPGGQPGTDGKVIGAGQVLDVGEGPGDGRANHQPDLLRATQDGVGNALALADAAAQRIEPMPRIQGGRRAILAGPRRAGVPAAADRPQPSPADLVAGEHVQQPPPAALPTVAGVHANAAAGGLLAADRGDDGIAGAQCPAPDPNTAGVSCSAPARRRLGALRLPAASSR